MRLTLEQLRSAASGAVSAQEEDGCVFFRRFTPAQERAAAARAENYGVKTTTTAGVRLCFRTSSARLRLEIRTFPYPASRHFFAADVRVDGRLVGSVDNVSGAAVPPDYGNTFRPAQTGACGEFALGPGEKAVSVSLPWSVRTGVRALELDDGASFVPAVPSKHLLLFGDSITQGYDALHPSLSYASRLAEALEMQENNKGIGAAVVFPELAACADDFQPDAVIVAYGSNDWGKSAAVEFEDGYRRFLAAVTANYPDAPVFALTPVTRVDMDGQRPMGPFSALADTIRRVAAGRPRVTVIDCSGFLPRDPAFFSDLRLHPNDAGFGLYFDALYPRVKAVLEARRG